MNALARAVISWCLRNPLMVGVLAVALTLWGGWALRHTPVDAIPDIGEKQVIVFADWPGRSPQNVDDQVTYPLTAALEGTPKVKTIRSMSGLGFAMVFVIFADDADFGSKRHGARIRTGVSLRTPRAFSPRSRPRSSKCASWSRNAAGTTS
jgi:Cu/Ag efflux pump CusA